MLPRGPYRTLTKLLPLLLIAAASAPSDGSQPAPEVPDFTEGGKIDSKHDWNLGPTGARGWMWGWKLQTTKARQIFITKVEAGSPAENLLTRGDLILGVNAEPFSRDARQALAEAIGAAEASDGRLNLIRWRDGETTPIDIELPILGAYSPSAPFDCQKSRSILTAGCQHIAKRMERELPEFRKQCAPKPKGGKLYGEAEITNSIDALALLASGDPQYLDLTGKYARALAPADLELAMNPSTRMAAWGWGYINLFLCEYFLATGDQSVFPAIEKYSTSIAQGQSFIGSWGHSMAWPAMNQGKFHGSLMGYGAINSAGLVCHLSLVLAEKCGIGNSEIRQAINRSNRFFGFYAGKGSIPYGDHFPNWGQHDDNGKNSMAAVLFDLQGEEKASRFFTSMVVASHSERERGHTGNYFSFLWGPLGAQRAGDSATAAFLKPQRWFYDLNRTWDGRFPYQGGANSGAGEHSYKGWDSTGAFMLTYALPLKKLHITGKLTEEENQLTGERLDQVIAAGEGFTVWDNGLAPYRKKQMEPLLRDLKSWSPAVRTRAAAALAEKPAPESLVPALIRMLGAGEVQTRYGACQALGALKGSAKDAVPTLRSLLRTEDTWLRIQAVSALANIGEASSSAIPELLRLAITDDEDDPLQITQRYLAFSLFDEAGTYGRPGLLSKSLRDVDRELLYQVVKKLLSNPDGRTRGTIASVYDTLSFEELKPILPAIVEAIREPSPSGVMFSSSIRIRGVKVLAKYRVREGMSLCLEILEIDKWGKRQRLNQCLEILATYGGAAKPLLPQLRELEKELLAHPEAQGLKPQIEQLRQLIQEIEASNGKSKLRSLD